jgi:hypothetical protein
MATLKMKNEEIVQLSTEIDLIAKELRKVDDLGKQINPDFLPKFHIATLSRSIEGAMKTFNDMRNEIIKKYGVEDEKGNVSVKQFVEGTEPVESPEEGRPSPQVTEEFKSFLKDIKDLSDQEVEVSITDIPVAVFEKVKTDNFYPTFYKFVK